MPPNKGRLVFSTSTETPPEPTTPENKLLGVIFGENRELCIQCGKLDILAKCPRCGMTNLCYACLEGHSFSHLQDDIDTGAIEESDLL